LYYLKIFLLPLGGLLIIDQKPVVPDVAVKLTVLHRRKEFDQDQPKLQNKGFLKYLKATVGSVIGIWQPVSKTVKNGLSSCYPSPCPCSTD
jgi:hypothetical protein